MGLVSEFEEREATVYVGYTWMQWLDLPWHERAASVAHYRLHLAVDAHIQHAANKKVSRNAS